MKYSTATLALLAAPFASAASSLDAIPSCAQSAIAAGISATGCAESNFACICGNSQFVTSVYGLIEKGCSAADQQVTLAFASDVCKAVGVSLNIPTAAATTSSTIPATSAASVPSAIETASATSSASASATATATPTPSAPYAFANGTSNTNGTNSTIPFTGDAGERRAMGFQLAGSALSIAVLMGIFL